MEAGYYERLEFEIRNMKQQAIRWLWKLSGGKKYYIFLLTGIQIILGFSGVLYAILLKNIVDGAVAGDTERFWKYIALTLLLVVVQVGLRALVRHMAENAKSFMENLLKKHLLENILSRDYATVTALHSGEWLNRLTSDTAIVANGCVDILPGSAGMVVKIISALIMIIMLEARLALVIIPLGAVLIMITYLFRRKMKQLHKDVREKDGRLRVFLQERLGSLMILRSFSAEKSTLQESDEYMEAHRGARMRRNRYSNICNIGYGTAMNVLYLLGICYCGYGILKGTITFGTLTAITQLISQIQTPISSLTSYIPQYFTMTASAERLMEIENFPREEGNVHNIGEVLEYYGHDFESLELKDATFTYSPVGEAFREDGKENMPVVISGLNLMVKKGEYTAFTGHSGSGKTTILKLLMCMYPLDEGKRLLNDNNGGYQDLTFAWRRLFAYVPQGNYLMSGTIRQIVCFADPGEESEEKFREALRISCAADFVYELEQGVDTLLGERGAGLSEGQMQRIAIARAIYSSSPILLLDEATSALDETTEVRLLENLRSMTDKTVIIVTHRRAALSICDKQIDIAEMTVMD